MKVYKGILVALPVLFIGLAIGQVQPTEVHLTDFNSSLTLTQSQIEAAQLDEVLADNVQNVINFDRTQLAFGGPWEDSFYDLPALTNTTGPLKPGQLLKVQPLTDPTAYAIPPFTSLSRILYTTTNFNGTVIPTSAFILWPYVPRKFGDDLLVHRGDNFTAPRAPVVIWAHGTSGFFRTQSPSTHRGLWYDNSGPFALAQAGYVVFAPDFAGLGISKSWDGSEIPHQYHASPTTAHDSLYGFRAALKAFPDALDENFVVMGHSQGGGVAWAVAEALAAETEEFADLAAAYKGAVAASPTTDVFASSVAFMLPAIGTMLDSIFPTFKLDDWLTPIGVARANLVKQLEGGIGVFQQLFLTSNDTTRPDWRDSWYADAFSKLGNAGRKDFKGPMLVLQGTTDQLVPYEVTSKSIKDTSEMFPGRDLEFLVASGVGHVPVLSATRHLWLQWIDDRLGGKPLRVRGSFRTDLEGFRSIEQYLSQSNSFPLWAGLPQYTYEVSLAL